MPIVKKHRNELFSFATKDVKVTKLLTLYNDLIKRNFDNGQTESGKKRRTLIKPTLNDGPTTRPFVLCVCALGKRWMLSCYGLQANVFIVDAFSRWQARVRETVVVGTIFVYSQISVSLT